MRHERWSAHLDRLVPYETPEEFATQEAEDVALWRERHRQPSGVLG